MEDIIPYISALYTEKDVKKIVRELHEYILTLPKRAQASIAPNWYKEASLYTLYPDSIMTEHAAPLENIKDYLPQIKDLGCNAVHILPFLASPMQDKGFDVSDYYKVREGLGGIETLREVVKTAEKLGMHMFMDLIFNHVSDQHEWFVKAQSGDEYYRNFFIYTKEMPQFLGKVYKKSAIYAEYLIDGEKNLVSVAFPEFAGEIPHWVKGKDGFWYYHTYYPSQIDLNWKNPEVFIALTKVLLFWASEGFHFRLDAIPFVGKSAYKHLNTHNVFTHHLTAVFPMLARLVNEQCIFILETNEKMDAEIEYFGTANIPQAHMLYSFHLTTALWVTLTQHNARYIWEQLQQNQHIPAHAQWLNFLRNHDELSLAYLQTKQIEKIQKNLLPYGKAFRSGFGIAGRTYSLLASDEKRFLMAYFLLISLPGSTLIPYGDEYGIGNIPVSQLPTEEQQDFRNINRGYINHTVLQRARSKRIFWHIKTMLAAKKLLKDYLNVWPQEIAEEEGIFGEKYSLGTSELVVFINLTKSQKSISFDTTGFQEVANVNTFEITKSDIHLGPYGGIWLQK